MSIMIVGNNKEQCLHRQLFIARFLQSMGLEYNVFELENGEVGLNRLVNEFNWSPA